ncbi:DUF2306 domain-containing protein [Bacillus sp. JJ664]
MKSKKSWWVLLIVSIGVMIPFIGPYLTINPTNSRIQIESSSIQYPALILHIFFATIALLTGFLQFNARLRKEKPQLHRLVGKAYISSVLLSGLLAFVIILYIDHFAKATSFISLTIIWLFATIKGYVTARQRNFSEHRKWMIRSFGVTLVAVSGRLTVPILLLTYYLLNGFSLPGGRAQMVEEVLNVNIWVGFIINVIIIEWVILTKKPN